MNDAYYKESLSQWIKYVSKHKKFVPFLCIASIAVGLLIIRNLPSFQLTGFLGIGIGAYEGIKYILWKEKWLTERKSDKYYGQEVEFIFHTDQETVIQVKPKPIDEELKPVLKTNVAKKGDFIYMQDGEHIYIPNSSF